MVYQIVAITGKDAEELVDDVGFYTSWDYFFANVELPKLLAYENAAHRLTQRLRF